MDKVATPDRRVGVRDGRGTGPSYPSERSSCPVVTCFNWFLSWQPRIGLWCPKATPSSSSIGRPRVEVIDLHQLSGQLALFGEVDGSVAPRRLAEMFEGERS